MILAERFETAQNDTATKGLLLVHKKMRSAL
jgi:hypothetical protein